MEKRLNELNFDEEGIVKEIDESLVRQVAGMGVRIGKNVRMATKQPMKGPVVIEIDKSFTSLGCSMAEKIVVEVKK
ncbi:MAG: FeoA domain protein [Candidatus Argoarchaeum ethanivorans]|uniref:FeoA domain protein n=1 Tax=Candidatus Argoarchaeum ethanivorans TaxID=2608793 RepID=A0A811TC46_9EURY|nr:MAG: FeoA domain protein [Candidatus Argoarchaeum ethanivorans]